MNEPLQVTFVDELYEVDDTESLTFGRDADIIVDDQNPFMHRVIGRFLLHKELWWVHNEGRKTDITLLTGVGKLTQLPPGESAPLTSDTGIVRFDSGALSYELEYRLPGSVQLSLAEKIESQSSPDTTATRDFGIVRLNAEQRLLLTSMCEARLRDAALGRTSLPANAEIANSLGWSLKKFDRKLDYLCVRFNDAGVKGLRGGTGYEASERRQTLVDHVLSARLLDETDLAALEKHRASPR